MNRPLVKGVAAGLFTGFALVSAVDLVMVRSQERTINVSRVEACAKVLGPRVTLSELKHGCKDFLKDFTQATIASPTGGIRIADVNDSMVSGLPTRQEFSEQNLPHAQAEDVRDHRILGEVIIGVSALVSIGASVIAANAYAETQRSDDAFDAARARLHVSN